MFSFHGSNKGGWSWTGSAEPDNQINSSITTVLKGMNNKPPNKPSFMDITNKIQQKLQILKDMLVSNTYDK